MNSSIYTSTNRIILVDSLRGFALMGLFMVHMVEYFELYWYKPEESIFNDISFFLFGGKAFAVFALLFGLSFFIILDNQSERGIDFRKRFAWRLLLLLFLGFLHGLIYGGDILQLLALTGFLLLPIFKAKNYFLLTLAAVFLFQIPAILHIVFFNISEPPAHWALFGPVLQAYAEGSFTDLLKTTLWNSQLAKWSFMFESGRLSTIIGMSILGFWLGRIHFFKNIKDNLRSIKILFGSFLLLTILLMTQKNFIYQFINPTGNWFISTVIGNYINLSFIVAGVSGFVLLYQLNYFGKFLSLLAPCGRMSLTIYVSQSLFFVPFFYGFGFGAYDFIGQTASFFLGILFWIIQVALAHYWIQKYHFGPLEWVWRSATYLRRDIAFKKA